MVLGMTIVNIVFPATFCTVYITPYKIKNAFNTYRNIMKYSVLNAEHFEAKLLKQM